MSRPRPNFVVIYTDDLGYGDLGCTGSDTMKTPHLDRLAEQGVRFTNWYSNSPVCSPSRASLLTGRVPMRAGVPSILGGARGTAGLPKNEKTLATLLKPHGYKTGLIGKWHLGVAPEYQPNAHGFDDFYGFLAGCIDYYSHIFYWQQGAGVDPVHDLWHNGEEVWDNGRYFTELISAKSVEFIEDNADEPFFLFASYNAPHYPMHAPQEYIDRFPDLPRDRQIMAAMIAAVDDGVGDIMAALERAGVADNTVIFFSSDNGPSRETRNWLDGTEDPYYGGTSGIFRGHKFSLFDGGIRMPALMRWPNGIPAGQVCGELGVMMDVVPTCLEIARIDLPDDLNIDGRSVLKMVSEGAPSPHERVFWELNNQLAVREDDWKLVLNGRVQGEKPDPIHLSNLADDPRERVNRRDDQPALTERLTNAVQAWHEDVKAELR